MTSVAGSPSVARSLTILTLAAAPVALAASAQTEKPLDGQAHAILAERCFSCHAADRKGGLDLRTSAAALKGGGRGPALKPGRPDESLLIRMVSGHAKPAMPPGKPLDPEQVQLLKRWIQAGAPWPAPPKGNSAFRTPHSALTHWSFKPPVRPAVPQPRTPALRKWVRNPIDAFIAVKLEAKGLTPAPEADRRTLLRRVTLDLTGLPPTPEEIQAFLADRSPDAYEKVVKRLLASPQYGVRWAQHWLDVVRFAETNGFELDADRPQAWRYRDWVVNALNADMPYDRFLRDQIAGDEVAPEDFDARVATGFLRAGPQHVVGGNQDLAVNRQEWLTEAVAGVGNGVLALTIGCARCHDHKYDPVSQKEYYQLQAFFAAADNQDFRSITPEQKQAYDQALAAHQARLKPIQAAIAAIEKPYRERLRAAKMAKLEPKYAEALNTPAEKRTPEQKRLAGEAGSMLNLLWDEVVNALSPADREKRAGLRRQMHAIALEAPEPLPMAPSVTDTLNPVPESFLLVRGEVHKPGEKVAPGVPAVIQAGAVPAATPAGKTSGRRLALVNWLTRPDHPLTGRVLVNRLWQHHFGRGLVATPNDFGKNGQRPTHPELLDWLATGFAGVSGSKLQVPGSNRRNLERRTWNLEPWSLKRMHELLVTSATYRQSSALPPSAFRLPPSKDPENRLLWRMNRVRLDAEALRDTVLTAAGTLNPQTGGPSIRVPLEPEVYDTIFTEGEPDNLWPIHPDRRQHTRRSLYLLRKRNVRLPMLAVFDQPDMMTSCGARGQSVHALQALTLLNSDFMLAQSRALATRLLVLPPAERSRRLFEVTVGRPPTSAEARAAERFLKDQIAIIRQRLRAGETVTRLDGLPESTDPAVLAERAAWADLCLATLNMNEFAYRN